MNIIMRIFSNVPIIYKILFIAVTPLAMMGSFMYDNMQRPLKQKASMQNMMQAATLSQAAYALLGELQKERDLSAAYMGGQTKKISERLKLQHNHVNHAYANFQDTLKTNISILQAYPDLQDVTSHFMLDMEEREGIQSNIRSPHSMTVLELIDYYSDMINDMFRVTIDLRSLYTFTVHADGKPAEQSEVVANARFSGFLSSLILLSRVEEAASLERALLSYSFAKKQFEKEIYEQSLSLIVLQQHMMQEFILQSPEYISQLIPIDYEGSATTVIMPFREIAKQYNSTSKLHAVSANQWFDISSKRINLLHQVEHKIIALIRSNSLVELNQADEQFKSMLVREVLTVVVASGLSFGVAWFLLLGIRMASQSAQLIAKGDYSVPIHVTGKNELGRMLDSIEHMRVSLQAAERARIEQTEKAQFRLEALEKSQNELSKGRDFIERLLAAIPAILIGVNGQGKVSLWNATAERVFGLMCHDVIHTPFSQLNIQWDWQEIQRALKDSEALYECSLDHVKFQHVDGSDGVLGLTINAVVEDGRSNGFLLVGADITKRIQLENQLQVAQKMEAMGELAAGIAHEINTPMQYIGDNVRFLNNGFEDIMSLLSVYKKVAYSEDNPDVEDVKHYLAKAEEDADIEFLRSEIPIAITQSLEGVDYVGEIVFAMKELSHPGSNEKIHIDINQVIKNTLTISCNEWKYVANIDLKLDPNLQPVLMLPEINQVFLNIIINAAHAIEELMKLQQSTEKGEIMIRTLGDEHFIHVYITDSGVGISPDQKDKIFDPFYTTKEIGTGTGQGLSISHQIVCGRLGGEIFVESELGKGTTFTIKLPVLKN